LETLTIGTLMKKYETVVTRQNTAQTFDFDKHRYLFSGNPFLFTK
jgi:hypothetical protein